MAKRGEWVPVKRGDHERVLITETLPFETPIIFSGDGFYTRIKKSPSSGKIHSDLVDMLVLRKGSNQARVTIPFSYKVRKGVSDFRGLAALHPSALWDVRRFYEQYDEWMIYECSRSPISIRAPFKVSGSFYEKGDADAVNQFKQGQIITADIDSRSRYNPSYFSYRGYTRLYRFFFSYEFMNLEQRYEILKTLDVSHCFDSIYTHSIAWALMGKPIAKKQQTGTTANAFDALMRNVNHAETSGIVIGPEVSRIFAEMIFQTIDLAAIRNLEKLNLRHGQDYSLRRYVDDIFIFAGSIELAERVSECYADAMAAFNLYSNPNKMRTIPRPFATARSTIIDKTRLLLESLCSDLFANYKQGRTQLRPAEIWRSSRITRDFLTAIKSICLDAGGTYYDISSYLISAFCERMKRLVKRSKALSEEEEVAYCKVMNVMLRLMFFLYAAAPSVNASYQMALGMVLALRFARRRLTHESPVIEELIYSEAIKCLDAQVEHKSIALSTFVSLESINILLALRELGDAYLIPSKLAERLFSWGKNPDGWSGKCYFDIATCMYYIGTRPEYAQIKGTLDVEVDRRLSDLSDLSENAERAYLFLDMLTCPHIMNTRKELWINQFCAKFSLPVYTAAEIQGFLTASSKCSWFINWEGVDILTMLQKKEVVRVY
jgi:hypothetical protein